MADRLDEVHAKEPKAGAHAAALALRALAAVLEECRVHKLTRHQHVTFKLGKLICAAETAAIFSTAAAAQKYSETVRFDREGWQAMARIFAREAALNTAMEGLALVLGAVESDGSLADAVNIEAIQTEQRGMMADMDLVALKLKQAFKAK